MDKLLIDDNAPGLRLGFIAEEPAERCGNGATSPVGAWPPAEGLGGNGMGFLQAVGRMFNSGPATEETVGQITQLDVDPLGDGKSSAFRMDSMPEMQFRQQSNVLTSIHKVGERVKVVYSLTSAGVATVDYIQQV